MKFALSRFVLGRAAGYFFLLLCALCATGKTGVYVDDVFITLTYARNLAAGEGMVFRPGEWVFGTTTPLWCWLNALGFLILPSEKHGAAVCGWLFLFATLGAASGIERFARRLGWKGWGFLGGAAFILTLEHAYLFGLETSLAIWLALEIVLAFEAGRRTLAGILSGLLILARPEAGCLPALLFGADLLVFRRWRETAKAGLGAMIVLAPALVFLAWQFGTILPNTLSAKQGHFVDPLLKSWWRSVPAGARSYMGQIVRGPKAPTALLLLGCYGAAASALPLFQGSDPLEERQRRGRVALAALWAWGPVHVAALGILGIPFYGWYLYPIWLLVAFAMGTGAAVLAQAFGDRGKRWGLGGAMVLAALTLIACVRPWRNDPAAGQRDRYKGYHLMAARLTAEAAPSGDQVQAQEIGILGFYTPNSLQVFDEYGLVEHLEPGQFLRRETFIARYESRFLVESHPASALNTPELVDFVTRRMQPDFTFVALGRKREAIPYRPLEQIRNSYGAQILLKRQPVANPENAESSETVLP